MIMRLFELFSVLKVTRTVSPVNYTDSEQVQIGTVLRLL